MTIIVFLLDTSASMNQRAYLGGRPSLLDVAKGAVETFVKLRQRMQESRGDRYMLMTYEDPPANIKAGWKENLAMFMTKLKNLQAVGMTAMGAALKNVFDVLNINRMQTGIDTYGQGRCPFYLEPSVIVVITDGGKLSSNMGVQEELNLPMHSPIPGSELTREPFRWDQRLFSLVLRLTGTPAVERMDSTGHVPSDTSPIDAMCEVTGGRSYAVSSHKMLMQCIDSLVQKVQSGVVINFEKIGLDPPLVVSDNTSKGEQNLPDVIVDGEVSKNNDIEISLISTVDENTESQSENTLKASLTTSQNEAINSRPQTPNPVIGNASTAWHNCRKLIYVPRSAQKGFAVGFWPIPEAFWPDVNAQTLPARSAHPIVKFTCTSQEPMVIENLPFDKYELEPSPLTQFILSRKQTTTCWQVFVSNSCKNMEIGQPFGYLKASTNLHCVNLFVMPYNYPVLLPLLEELFKVHRLKPSNDWRVQFSSYLRTMPAYYAGPLRRALTRMGAPNLAQSLIPESLDNNLSYSVLNHLKRIKNQAKMEYDRLCNEVGKQKPVGPDGIRINSRTALRKDQDLISNPTLRGKFNFLRDQLNEFNGYMIAIRDWEVKIQSYRNPFDIPRKSLLDQVVRMRANYLQPALSCTRLQDEDQMHSMPVGQMGNYQEYLKRLPSCLREIESAPVRQHMFGNPFKIDKQRMMMVDEADIDGLVSGGVQNKGTKRVAETNSASSRPNKRKPGPLPKDIIVRRPTTPPVLRPPSPSPPSPPSPGQDEWFEALAPLAAGENPCMDVDTESVSSRAPFVNGIEVHSNPPERSRSPSPTSDIISTEITNHIGVEETPSELTNHIGEVHAVEEACEAVVKSRDVSPSRVDGQNNPNNRLNHLDLKEVKKHNLKIRGLVYKEVRRPGRNFQNLFSHLNTVQGELETRIAFVQDIVNESLRFKRKFLAQSLENFLESMVNAESSLTSNHYVINSKLPGR